MSKTITEDPEGQPGQTGLKRRPSRNLSLPEPPTDRTLDFAASRPELRNIDPGETVLAVEALEGFERVIKAILGRIDAKRKAPRPGESKRRGQASAYHAIDYWRLELLRRVIGERSTEKTRNWLTTDKAVRTRQLLGFNVAPCSPKRKARRPAFGETRVSADLGQETSRRAKAGPAIRRAADGGSYTPPKKSGCFGPTVTTTGGSTRPRASQVATRRAYAALAAQPRSSPIAGLT
jgi:hypothetical protein